VARVRILVSRIHGPAAEESERCRNTPPTGIVRYTELVRIIAGT